MAHFIINALGTIILAGTNYCMQCLSAPTRNDVDKAHAKGLWLNIGILSLRNLRRISRKKLVVWISLAVTSLPLHLFYNSVVFASIGVNDYKVLSVNKAFLDAPSVSNFTDPESILFDGTPELLHKNASNGLLRTLDPIDCIQAYAQDFLTDKGDLLLVTRDESNTAAAIYNQVQVHPVIKLYNNRCVGDIYEWICSSSDCSNSCRAQVPSLLNDAPHWKPFNTEGQATIAYCLSQPETERCKLQFSVDLAIVVLVINFLKFLLMLYTVIGLKEAPLITTGDAIASFLEREDNTTYKMCMDSKDDVTSHFEKAITTPRPNHINRAKHFGNKSVHYGSVISGARWCTCILL